MENTFREALTIGLTGLHLTVPMPTNPNALCADGPKARQSFADLSRTRFVRLENAAISPQSEGEVVRMYKVTGKGTIENFDGKPVVPKLTFEYEYDAFGTSDKMVSDAEFAAAVQEMRDKNKFPSDAELVGFGNTRQKQAARQKANDNCLEAAGYEKLPLDKDTFAQLKLAYKSAMASGRHTEESARRAASVLVGAEWPSA
jgi:hypothetical protein